MIELEYSQSTHQGRRLLDDRNVPKVWIESFAMME